MLDRFMVAKFVTALAIGAMVSFAGTGCGGGHAQHDAAPVQHDAAQDVEQHDVIQADHLQADAADPSGVVVVLKAAPQHSGIAQIDNAYGALNLSYVSATWDSLNDQDNPTTVLDNTTGPFGCSAKYYKKGEAGSKGGTTAYLPDNANAGDLTVSGYSHGVFYLGLDDGGVPITMPFADTITCKREEYPIIDDAGVDTDAGTGRHRYSCDNEVNHNPVPLIPTTAGGPVFLTPGTDKLEIKATGGGMEVEAFDITNVDVMPFIKVMPDGLLWALPTFAQNPAYNSDAGVPIHYACGDSDAGVDTAPCQGALAIQILWTDHVYAPGLDNFGTLKWDNERGEITCSKVGAANAYNIPWEIWNTAFPAGSSPHIIQAFVLHFSVKQANGGTTTAGAGGGQIGVTWM